MVQVQPHTRFEKARIIGARALQIGMGAPVVLQGMSTLDPVRVAEEEYRAGVIPITVAKRGTRVAPPSAAPARPARPRREAKAPAAP